ncbi:AAA family ATPase [Arsenicicoccus piscis]|uniref:ATP-dependent dethiobiotin synthetase BioD n=1 Tax=Arsenicicoccus piscis TaxID=673954 RepID=A0ABQ6HQY9_9MICO|nr:AAA family ATPase [Arsenicicoccus piscis]MCH8626279.1 AAA family ATPase [Arsenicicoccus piscis]GMA20876.1 ATP-dependent dethiobiotin synthetase BioD [Arsenicicoccus piscis]
MSEPGTTTLSPIIAVTGTRGAVGTSVVVRALQVGLEEQGLRVRVVQLDRPSLARPDPAAPPLPVIVRAAEIAGVARGEDVDLVLIDCAGGLLVPRDLSGAALTDLARNLDDLGGRVGLVVVTGHEPDDVEHAALTGAVLRARGLDGLGIAVGSWPEEPTEDQVAVRDALEPATGLPLLGSVPAGAGAWPEQEFADRAGAWLPL